MILGEKSSLKGNQMRARNLKGILLYVVFIVFFLSSCLSSEVKACLAQLEKIKERQEGIQDLETRMKYGKEYKFQMEKLVGLGYAEKRVYIATLTRDNPGIYDAVEELYQHSAKKCYPSYSGIPMSPDYPANLELIGLKKDLDLWEKTLRREGIKLILKSSPEHKAEEQRIGKLLIEIKPGMSKLEVEKLAGKPAKVYNADEAGGDEGKLMATYYCIPPGYSGTQLMTILYKDGEEELEVEKVEGPHFPDEEKSE
ncbi:hypothetical protein ACFL4W_03115 [Planctomycetota bacterium]